MTLLFLSIFLFVLAPSYMLLSGRSFLSAFLVSAAGFCWLFGFAFGFHLIANTGILLSLVGGQLLAAICVIGVFWLRAFYNK